MPPQELELGQKILVKDLLDLLNEVEAGEFGDFSNQKYATPKMALVEKFETFINHIKNGKYD